MDTGVTQHIKQGLESFLCKPVYQGTPSMLHSSKALVLGTVCLAIVLGYTIAGQKDRPSEKDKGSVKGKDKQVVTSKATKRTRAASINFKKAYNLPLSSLGTLGARIDA